MNKIFSVPFKATGDYNDNVIFTPFELLGLHQKITRDSNGDIIQKEFYKTYDDINDTFSDLAIKETRVYTRDNINGLPTKKVTDIEWYGEDDSIIHQRTSIEKYYTLEQGFNFNKKSRKALLEKASLYFYGELMTAHAGDRDLADADKNDFDVYTTTEQNLYLRSNIQPLIDKINNAADNQHADYKSYMTTTMAATIVAILNVNYDGPIP